MYQYTKQVQTCTSELIDGMYNLVQSV